MRALVWVVVCLVHGPSADGWTESSYPNPVDSPDACGMSASSWVCDPDHLITQTQANSINAELKKIHSIPNVCICRLCPSSMGVGVALINKVNFVYERTKKTWQEQKEFAIFSFAYNLRIFRWTFLKGECLNNAVILVTRDKEVEFSVSRDASYEIGWDCNQNIEAVGKKYISSGQYYEGIMQMTRMLRDALETGNKCKGASSNVNAISILPIVIGVVVTVIVLCCVCICITVCVRKSNAARRSQGGATYQPAHGAQVVVGATPQPHYPGGGVPHQPYYPHGGAPQQPHYPHGTAPPQVDYSAPPPQYPGGPGQVGGEEAPPMYNPNYASGPPPKAY